MAVYINEKDSLNDGRIKLNESIKDANQAKQDAITSLAKSLSAEQIAQLAKLATEDTQQQLDNIIIESGTSDAEVIQARGDNPLLKDRLNKTDNWLAETDEQVERNSNYTGLTSKEMFKREIIMELPMRFPDYLTVMQGYTDYIHPQSFCISEEDDLLFILYVPYDNSNMTTNWVVVYDWETGEYDRCFEVDSNGWEGIVVKYENNDRFLYVGNENNEGTYDLHKYKITNLPSNLARLTDYIQVDLAVDHRFNYYEGIWIFSEVSDSPVWGKGRRSVIKIMNDDFEVIKVININGKLRALLARNGPFPKVQGITITKNNILFSLGAAATNNNNITSRKDLQQGIIVADFSGNILKEGMLDNKMLQTFYEQLGYTPTKLENEGVWTNKKNEIYTLNILHNMNSEQSGNDPRGMLIVKEGSNNNKSVDFEKVGTPINVLDVSTYIGKYFPLTKGEYTHPVTQEKFESIVEMLDFAREYELPELNVYISGNEEIKGVSNKTVRYVYYSFLNTGGDTFFGLEYSQQGIRHVISSSNGTNYRNIVNKINVIDESKTVTINDVIKVDINLDYFETIEFVMQPNGLNNEVHAFKLKGRDDYEVRTFNMSDSSDETIAFMEIAFERVSNGIKLKKYNRHTYTGVSNSSKSINSNGNLTITEINVY